MNRKDLIARFIWFDEISKAAARAKKDIAANLNADARAEFEEQGTASTWRIPGMATVPQSVTNDAVVVKDEARFVEWVARRYPTEVEMVVREAFREKLLQDLIRVDADDVCHVEGELVPGVEFRKGGEFIHISVRPTPAAREMFGAVARATMLEVAAKSGLALEAGPAVPVVLAEVPDASVS